MNPLNSINGSANVLSHANFKQRYPDGRMSKREAEKTFVCRRACNTRTATYSEEFVWEDVFGSKSHVDELINYVKSNTKATRKRKTVPDEAVTVPHYKVV
jgi:origin recognition complex subunit 1